MTKHKGPGKADREGISLKQLMRMFLDDGAAQAWFEAQIWPDGPSCPRCGAVNIQHPTKHRSMTHRCRECKADFSLKTGTVMQGTKLGYQTWAFAIYLAMTGLKGISSMKLHRELEIRRRAHGILPTVSARRLRTAMRRCSLDRRTKWRLSSGAPSAAASATGSLSPTMACRAGRADNARRTGTLRRRRRASYRLRASWV